MAPKTVFRPETDISNVSAKVIFITGGTAGIGKETILALAKHHPKQIIFTGRNKTHAETVLAEVKRLASDVDIKYYECDQTSIQSVHAVANSFLATEPLRLDVLICNAGIMGGPAGLTQDGYEIQFGVNFLSHALFITRLIPLLEQTAIKFGEARVINLTSTGYAMYPGPIPLSELKTKQTNIGVGGKWARYAQSKFAQVIYGSELAKRHPHITVISVHPGVVNTNLVEGQPFLDRMFLRMTTLGQSVPREEGAFNTLWAASTPIEGNITSGGVYYPVGRHQKHTEAASDESNWRLLWEWTEKQLK